MTSSLTQMVINCNAFQEMCVMLNVFRQLQRSLAPFPDKGKRS